MAKVGTSNQDRTISLKAAVRSSTNNLIYLFYVLVAFSVRTGIPEIFFIQNSPTIFPEIYANFYFSLAIHKSQVINP